jgi:uncharacterized protein DUF1360
VARDGLSALLWFGLSIMAVWRVTHLLHVEDGPWGILRRGRDVAIRLGGGELLDCFFCLSLWTSAPVALWLESEWPPRVVVWLALSAGAILLEVKGLGGPPAVDEG